MISCGNFKLFDILDYSGITWSPIRNFLSERPSCRDRFATGGKAETQNAKLIGASRRGVRPHRGAQGNFDPDPGS